jgi:YbgC/YbaW family acyl-CoA thioester hydrolase
MRDTDATGIVYHPKYLEILNYAREEFLLELGILPEELKIGLGVELVVYNVALKFRRRSQVNTMLRIETCWPTITSQKIKISQEILSSGSCVVKGEIELAAVDVVGGKAVKIPQRIEDVFGIS